MNAIPVSVTSTAERLPKGEPIERRSNLTPEEFRTEFAARHKPVILTDALEGWRALGKWTPEFFAEEFPMKLLRFKYGGFEMKMKDFIPLVMDSSADSPAPYWTNNVVADYFPELMRDISPLPPHTQPNWAERWFVHRGMRAALNRSASMEIYIGGPGGKFPVLHWDALSTHSFLMQLHGVKQFWMWAPGDQEFMYPKEGGEWNLSPIRDVENPDLQKYPLFARARASTVMLEPGEMLFVPSRWWHTAKMITPCVTLSVNTLDETNWSNFREEMMRRGGTLKRMARRACLSVERLRMALGHQDRRDGGCVPVNEPPCLAASHGGFRMPAGPR